MRPCALAVGVLAAVVAVALSACAHTADSPEVAPTAAGGVRGVVEGDVLVFRGVPYAAAPVGGRRWRPPERVAAWEGVRSAEQFGPACTQELAPDGREPWTVEFMAPAELGVSEDCLTLNVWTPAETPDEPLPVLVYLHGGGFMEGSGAVPIYDGGAFARRGVVTVTVNYRVGVMGFLAHPELTAEQGSSGNYGILDQIAALEWVQANIASFGGDRERVTVAGQSAGAFCVYALMLSRLADDLFHQAIIQSGPPGAIPFAPLAEAERQGVQVQDAIGAESIAEMRALPVTAFDALSRRFMTPVADGRVLPREPNPRLVNDGPALLGLVLDETPPRDLDAAAFRAEIVQRYGESIVAFSETYRGPAREVLRQEAADRTLLQLADWAAGSREPRRLYLFSHIEPGPDAERWGAFHSSELPYVFDTLDRSPGREFTEVDRAIADRMNAYWANFIWTGDPNGRGLARWPALDAAAPVAIEIGDVVAIRNVPTGQKAALLRAGRPARGLFSGPPPAS